MWISAFTIIQLLQLLVTVSTAQQKARSSAPAPGQLQDSSRCTAPTNLPRNVRIRIRSKGRTARFLCDPGFTLVGRRFATCLRGRWTNGPPICIKTGCQHRNAPANGRVSENYGGSLLVYGCNPGYLLQGSLISSCDGALWNSSEPSCRVAIDNPPPFCHFEDPDLCGWTHDVAHDFEWKQNRFGTPSGHVGTGPSDDHTLGPKNGGHYMYLEASAPRVEGDAARLYSPVYKPELSEACFRFWYHMFGASTGSLRVYVKEESQVLMELNPSWSLSGDQGNQWWQGTLNVPKTNNRFQLVIEGVRGADYMGDSAVDDVELVPGQCEPVPTDVPGNSSTGSSEEEETSGASEVSTTTKEPYANQTSDIGTTELLEKEDVQTTDDNSQKNTTESFDIETTMMQNTTSSLFGYTDYTPASSDGTQFSTPGDRSTNEVTDGYPSPNETQSPICVLDPFSSSNSTESQVDSDWLISISNCTTQSTTSQLTTLPIEAQTTSSPESKSTPESTLDLSTYASTTVPDTTIPPPFTPSIITSNSNFQPYTSRSTEPFTSVTQFVTNLRLTTRNSITTSKIPEKTVFPLITTVMPRGTVPIVSQPTTNRLITPIATPSPRTSITRRNTPPFVVTQRTFSASTVTSVRTYRPYTPPPPRTVIYNKTPTTSRRPTPQPSTPTAPGTSIPATRRPITPRLTTRSPVRSTTPKRIPAQTPTQRPRLYTTTNRQPVITTRYPWTLRNTSRRFSPPVPTRSRTTTSTPFTTKNITTSGYWFLTRTRPNTGTTTFSGTTPRVPKGASSPGVYLTTRSKNDVIEDDSDEDYNQNEDTWMNITHEPFKFQEFTRPAPRPSSVKSEPESNMTVLATCSLLGVLLTICAAAVTYYFLSVRRRRPKQRSLSDDSEMRFLSQNEELEITIGEASRAK